MIEKSLGKDVLRCHFLVWDAPGGYPGAGDDPRRPRNREESEECEESRAGVKNFSLRVKNVKNPGWECYFLRK